MGLTPEQEARYDEIRKIKKGVQEGFLKQDGVIGVGVAFKKTGGRKTDTLAIRFYVQHKRDVPADQMLPALVQGYPTDVVEYDFNPASNTNTGTDDPPPGDPSPVDTKRYNPLVGGISIGPSRSLEAGTLGLMVKDVATGADMMLSCFHVMCLKDGKYHAGDQICQEARVDNSALWCGNCAALDRWYAGNLTMEDEDFGMDAAVARRTARGATSGAIVDIGTVAGFATVKVGTVVVKRGRSTSLTRGTVEDTAMGIGTDFGTRIGKVTLENQLLIESVNAKPFAVDGDSGSVVVNSDTMEVVGLLWAADEERLAGAASPIGPVLGQLKVTIPGSSG